MVYKGSLARQHALVRVLQEVLAGAEEMRRVGGSQGVTQRVVSGGSIPGSHLCVHASAHVEPGPGSGVHVPPGSCAGVPGLHGAVVRRRGHRVERP